jgi:hypothetical protein
MYALIAAGYVLGHCVVGAGLPTNNGHDPQDEAVRLLGRVEAVGLSDVVEAAGPAARTVATELLAATGSRSAAERRRDAWALSVGIALAAVEERGDA